MYLIKEWLQLLGVRDPQESVWAVKGVASSETQIGEQSKEQKSSALDCVVFMIYSLVFKQQRGSIMTRTWPKRDKHRCNTANRGGRSRERRTSGITDFLLHKRHLLSE